MLLQPLSNTVISSSLETLRNCNPSSNPTGWSCGRTKEVTSWKAQLHFTVGTKSPFHSYFLLNLFLSKKSVLHLTLKLTTPWRASFYLPTLNSTWSWCCYSHFTNGEQVRKLDTNLKQTTWNQLLFSPAHCHLDKALDLLLFEIPTINWIF